MTSVFIGKIHIQRGEQNMKTQTQGEDDHVKMVAETGVMQP